MAVYGAPLDDPEHCWHAARSAIGMPAGAAGLNHRWEAEGRGPLAMGIAVHSGPGFGGSLGAPRKKKYAVLGDTVNVASRMEGLNRDLGTGILISGAVLAVLRDRTVVRDRGSVAVKGRSEPVEIHELLSLEEAGRDEPGAQSAAAPVPGRPPGASSPRPRPDDRDRRGDHRAEAGARPRGGHAGGGRRLEARAPTARPPRPPRAAHPPHPQPPPAALRRARHRADPGGER